MLANKLIRKMWRCTTWGFMYSVVVAALWTVRICAAMGPKFISACLCTVYIQYCIHYTHVNSVNTFYIIVYCINDTCKLLQIESYIKLIQLLFSFYNRFPTKTFNKHLTFLQKHYLSEINTWLLVYKTSVLPPKLYWRQYTRTMIWTSILRKKEWRASLMKMLNVSVEAFH